MNQNLSSYFFASSILTVEGFWGNFFVQRLAREGISAFKQVLSILQGSLRAMGG
jgi:hypothetical protein